MKENSMHQRTGDNSISLQANNINFGITETEVREIIREENALLLENAKIIAASIAQKRLDNYTEVLMPKLVKAELLSVFNEPAFQVLFRKTEQTAICTERKTDYEILSELLIHKIEKSDDYVISTAVEKAISEVNNISDEALMTLTLIFSIAHYVPTAGSISKGFAALDSLYSHLLEYFELPKSISWLENLELINAVRINKGFVSEKFEDILYNEYDGYSCLGIQKNSNQYNEAIEKLKASNISINILVPNELHENYLRLPIFKKDSIDSLGFFKKSTDGKTNWQEFTELQKTTLKEIYDSYDKKNNDIKNSFNIFMDKYPSMKRVRNWWNQYIAAYSITLTPIGKVLASTNAVRIDSSLPNLINDSR